MQIKLPKSHVVSGNHEVVKTIRLLLEPTDEQQVHLKNLLADYRKLCNFLSHKNHKKRLVNSTELHHKTYRSAKKNTKLVANYVCAVLRQVTGAYKALATRSRNLDRKILWLEANNKKVSPKLRKQLDKFMSVEPDYSKSSTIYLDKATLRLDQKDMKIRVSTTVGNCQHISVSQNKYNLQQLAGVTIRKNTGGTLTYDDRKDRWYLHIPVTQTIVVSHGHVIGLDLGITDLIATSYGELPVDKTQHSNLMQRISKCKAHTARLQSNGSRNARRRLRQVSGRRRRAVRDFVHGISKKLVTDLSTGGTSIIVMEDLSRIRDGAKYTQKGMLASWFFHLLQQCIEYKAGTRGMLTLYVNPAGTSTTCSRCKGTEVIRDGKNFTCSSCKNYITDADINAAVNIRDKAGLGRYVSVQATADIRSKIIGKKYKDHRAAINQPTAA